MGVLVVKLVRYDSVMHPLCIWVLLLDDLCCFYYAWCMGNIELIQPLPLIVGSYYSAVDFKEGTKDIDQSAKLLYPRW